MIFNIFLLLSLKLTLHRLNENSKIRLLDADVLNPCVHIHLSLVNAFLQRPNVSSVMRGRFILTSISVTKNKLINVFL
jgi:hypothetical protein